MTVNEAKMTHLKHFNKIQGAISVLCTLSMIHTGQQKAPI